MKKIFFSRQFILDSKHSKISISCIIILNKDKFVFRIILNTEPENFNKNNNK